jgi:hypothetical protein
MRTTPLIGDKPWFGPRKVGWGLSPVSLEGWAVTGIVLGAGYLARRRWPQQQLVRVVPAVGLVAIALVKGTPPGGRRARAALEASTAPTSGDAG